MSSSHKSRLLSNIGRYGIDSRISKTLLSLKGTGIRMGEHVSPRPGYSPVIMDYRYYRSGDPVKDIDWKLSSRTEKLFIKIREGYRQTDFSVAVDGSPSMKASYDGDSSKFITALTFAYICGRTALASRDRLNILWGGSAYQVFSESELLETLIAMENDSSSPDFWDVLFSPCSNLFLISDFLIERERYSGFIRRVSHAAGKIYAFAVQDAAERDFTFAGRYLYADPETGAEVPATAEEIRAAYLSDYREHFRSFFRECGYYGLRAGSAGSDSDPLELFVRIMQ